MENRLNHTYVAVARWFYLAEEPNGSSVFASLLPMLSPALFSSCVSVLAV
jgi:hypothetical protein